MCVCSRTNQFLVSREVITSSHTNCYWQNRSDNCNSPCNCLRSSFKCLLAFGASDFPGEVSWLCSSRFSIKSRFCVEADARYLYVWYLEQIKLYINFFSLSKKTLCPKLWKLSISYIKRWPQKNGQSWYVFGVFFCLLMSRVQQKMTVRVLYLSET